MTDLQENGRCAIHPSAPRIGMPLGDCDFFGRRVADDHGLLVVDRA